MILTVDTISMAHTPESPYGTPGAYVDSSGVEWYLTAEKGWWGSPATRPKRTAKVTAHGSWRAAAYRDIRTVSLSGLIVAPTDLLMRQAQQKLAAICSDPTLLYPLTVQDETGSYTAAVELDGEILTQPRNWCSVEFSLQLAAPDPRKYSASIVATSTGLGNPGTGGVDATSGVDASSGVVAGTSGAPAVVGVANAGTSAVGPVVQFIGPVTNPVVADAVTGAQVQFTGTVDAGLSLYINCDDHPQPTLDGQLIPGHAVLQGGTASRRSQLSIFGGWPVVPAGTTRQFLFYGSSSGSPTMTVHYRSAWR